MDTSVAVWHRRKGPSEVVGAPTTQCASVLKPVYSWLCEHPEWDTLAARSITSSDNLATSELTGGDTQELSNRIKERTGVRLAEAETWGRFQVSALTLAQIYHAMDTSSDERAQQVKDLMGRVIPAQRMGFHGTLKAGWDLYEDARLRPHLVTNFVLFGSRGGVTVVNDRVVTAEVAQTWQTRVCDDPSAVIPLHLESLQNPRLHDLVGRGVSRLIAL